MPDTVNSRRVIRRRLFLSVIVLVFSTPLSACATYHEDRQIDDTLGAPGPIANLPG
ncbi:hypothetical protein [Brucella anthropi]|uniref:hypothetical protein n=1 Tax=Brucella anthropi TaxID=529 RepID=UPI00398754B4